METNVYLSFDGRCEEAFNYYATRLGGRIEALMRHAGTPAEAHVPPEWREKIMHARLVLGNTVIMGSDGSPGTYEAPAGFAMALHIQEPQEAERIFGALAEEGNVRMPMQETFWAVRFGMVTDRFGIPWMVNCDQAPAGATQAV